MLTAFHALGSSPSYGPEIGRSSLVTPTILSTYINAGTPRSTRPIKHLIAVAYGGSATQVMHSLERWIRHGISPFLLYVHWMPV